jgi:hypothetical protein
MKEAKPIPIYVISISLPQLGELTAPPEGVTETLQFGVL